VGALLLWALRPHPFLWALVAAYGIAWLLAAYSPGDRKAGSRGVEIGAAPWKAAALLLVLLAIPLLRLHGDRVDLLWNEGLYGVGQQLQDRLRLEKLPAIAPPVVFSDHPQSLYVHAPDADEVSLDLGAGTNSSSIVLEGEDLGSGLFRLRYDPRKNGILATETASVEATLLVDGSRHRRDLAYVRPEAHPRWFSSAPEAGLAAAASEETDEVFILNRGGLQHRIPVGDGPTDTAFFAQGTRLAVAHRYDSQVWILDPATGEILNHLESGSFQMRVEVSGDGGTLAVARGGLSPEIRLYSLPSLEPLETLPLKASPDWIAFGTTADEILYSSASSSNLFRISKEAVLEKPGIWAAEPPLSLGRPVVTMEASLDGGILYVATTDYSPSGDPHRGNHFIQDQILAIDTATWEVRQRLLTARRTPRQTQAGNLDSGVSPMGMVAGGDGSLLVAFAGTDEVWILPDGLTGEPKIIDGYALDLVAPHGVADLGLGYWAASSPGGGAIAVYGPDGDEPMVAFVGVAPPDDDLFHEEEGSLSRQALNLRSGELAFYESTRSGISCQSRHLHGGTDGAPHDIGQTPLLPTLTTRGITGTAPYLRDGSFPRIRDLNDNLAETLYRGYQRRDSDRRLALEAFVESLPREVNPRLLEEDFATPASLERQRRGAAAFVAGRCLLCHTFPAFTNLSQHPTRSLFPEYGRSTREGAEQSPTLLLDTPALLGTHARTHFLQDGRAHSLAEVLDEHNASNLHGDSAALTEEQRGDLIYFLESL